MACIPVNTVDSPILEQVLQMICVIYQCKFIGSEKIGPVILVAFTAHHTVVMTCNRTWQINMGLYADQSIPFTLRVHTTAEIKPTFVIKQRDCGVCFSSIPIIKVPVLLNSL